MTRTNAVVASAEHRNIMRKNNQQESNDDMPLSELQDPPPVVRKGALIAEGLARLPKGDEGKTRYEHRKTVGIYRRRAKNVNRSYWVVILDKACSLPYERMVEAIGPRQAGAKAVQTANAENGYGPDEDGGFVPVVAYDRTELLDMLVDLDEHESSRDR